MINLLGQDSNGSVEVIGIQEAYRIPGVNIHIYGKDMCKIGRKMGHITVTADTLDEVLEKASQVKKLVKIIGK